MFTPLTVGICAIAITVVVHALALSATVAFVRRERRLGRFGTGFWIDVAIGTRTIAISLAAHLVEIAVWAVLFLEFGEFPDFQDAFYHSAVNYTTLGYGDVIMRPSWSLLGPLEAVDGMLMFGVSTAIIFAVIQRMLQTRFADLREWPQEQPQALSK